MKAARILSPLLFMIGLAGCTGGGSDSPPSSSGAPSGPGSGGSAGLTITALALPLPTGFAAIHNGELVWGDRDKNINLQKASLAGGVITPLALHFHGPTKVMVRGQDIYWSEDVRVGRLRQNDTVEILAEGSRCSNSGNYASDFTVDDTYVYRLANSPNPVLSDACSIERINLSDGTSTTLADNPTGPIFALTQDTAYIYWAELSRGLTGGETNSIKRVAKIGGASQTLNSSFNRFQGGLVVKGANIFFGDTSFNSCRIVKVPVTGGTLVALADPGITTGCTRGIDADLSNVYWIDDQTVRSVSVNGGAVTTLTTGLNAGVSIAVGSTDVFWIEHLCCSGGYPSRISRVPIGGGPISIVTDGMFGAHTLSLDSVALYWGEGKNLPSGMGRIAKAPIIGGQNTTVLDGIANDSDPMFAVGDTAAFVVDGATIKKVSLDGGLLVDRLYWNLALSIPSRPVTDGSFVYFVTGFFELIKVPINGGIAETLAFDSARMSGPLAVGGGFVYWIDQPFPTDPYSINRTPTSGGPTVTFVSGLTGSVGDMLIDSRNLYWVEEGSGAIRKIALSGGPVTTLRPNAGIQGPTKLAQDDTSIYWANDSQVGKVPKIGGPASFYESGFEPRLAIGVDSTSVYWVTELALIKATPK